MKKFSVFILFLLSTLNLYAQTADKLPKVIEMEMFLTNEATKFLESRIVSDKKIFVKASVDPILRNKDDNNDKEDLPYFISEDDTVLDEWKVLETPIIVLLSRIKKANITVEIQADLTDSEYMDLKDKLYEHLKLVPLRDNIEFIKKPLIKNYNKDYTTYIFGFILTLMGLIGLYFVLKLSNRHNAKESNSTTNTASNLPAPAISIPNNVNNSKSSFKNISSGSFNSKVQGDINFKDSIRAADMLKEKLHVIVNAQVFPTLSDMIVLEELANKKIDSFGAFLSEMTKKSQQKVFFKAPTDKWFKGFLEAGTVDLDCFMAVEKMIRLRGSQNFVEKNEELLIAVWRLGEEDSVKFFKNIDKEDAFTILSQLPKQMSVPCAKKSFPGGWARILENEEYKEIDLEKMDKYIAQTLEIKPYFNFKSIDEYKKDLELIEYLKRASLIDEEEIYESLKSTSHLFDIRPPFYKIFKADEDLLKDFVNQFELNQWAIVLFNAPKNYVSLIKNCFDEKKKYLFSNYMKHLDENEFDYQIQNNIRENMAKIYYQNQKNILLFKKNNKGNENNENDKIA